MMDALPPDPDRLMFEAVVAPHRSLAPRHMAAVIGCMALGSLIVTSLMVVLGAWPVIGFNGADISLAAFLFWLNIRAARAREIITLTSRALCVANTDLRGRRSSITLAPYWLSVTLQERAGTVPKLLLTTRGHTTEVARQLGEAQKRDLAAALTRALQRLRTPRFDNPQLRDPV
jgi:uncharacterized membrane protein